jgi:hypothetical protein
MKNGLPRFKGGDGELFSVFEGKIDGLGVVFGGKSTILI